MLTLLNIIGTRPEAIKMAPVIRESCKYKDRIKTVVCLTGQHKHMIEEILQLFQIIPDYDLQIMLHDQSLSGLSSNIFSRLDPVIRQTKPDWVLVQGDTTSVMISALAAFYNKISIAHIEAGLRTYHKYSPYPEEMNRQLTDRLADLLFAPTEKNKKDLLSEGIPSEKIIVTGNTVVDAFEAASRFPYQWDKGPMASLPSDKKIILITAHRRESFGNAFKDICLAVRDLAQSFCPINYHFVYPVHLNPNVQKPVDEILSGLSNISLIKPLDYHSMINLMKKSSLILTDSGGIQEEALSVGVPVLVMRDVTERTEALESGLVRLVGTKRNRIVEETEKCIYEIQFCHANPVIISNPYGDGKAAERIVSSILEHSI